MAYQLFSFILLIPCLLGIGHVVSLKFGTLYPGISSKIVLGIVATSLVWTVLSFFIPLNIYVEISTLLLGYASLYLNKMWKEGWNSLKNQNILFYFTLFLVCLFSSFYPFILDHFGYYVPTINWISKFGLVKGIGNLDLILGQMSIWHIFQAGFSHISDLYLRINGLVLLVYIFYIFEKKSWTHMVFLPFLFLFIQSPSPDLPVLAFSLLLLNEFLDKNKNATLIFALSIWVFSIKPTVIWLPLFAFFYGFFILKSHFKFILPGVFVLVLFLVKNVYCFGYPIFPIDFLDLNFSWKPNSEIMKTSAKVAVEKTFDMQFSFQEIQKFTFTEKVKNWLFLEGIKSKIHLLFMLSLVLFTLFTIKQKKKIIWILYICILIKTIFVLAFSAQYRFFLELYFVIFYLLFQNTISKKTSTVIMGLCSVFIFLILSFPKIIQTQIPSFKLGYFLTGFEKDQLLHPVYFELKNYQTFSLGNLTFHVSKDYPYNFDTPVPSISTAYIQEYYDAGIFPQLNGNGLKSGFVWKKLNREEMMHLNQILLHIKKP